MHAKTALMFAWRAANHDIATCKCEENWARPLVKIISKLCLHWIVTSIPKIFWNINLLVTAQSATYLNHQINYPPPPFDYLHSSVQRWVKIGLQVHVRFQNFMPHWILVILSAQSVSYIKWVGSNFDEVSKLFQNFRNKTGRQSKTVSRMGPLGWIESKTVNQYMNWGTDLFQIQGMRGFPLPRNGDSPPNFGGKVSSVVWSMFRGEHGLSPGDWEALCGE